MSPMILVNTVDDKSLISSETLVLKDAISFTIVVNTTFDKSLISSDTLVLKLFTVALMYETNTEELSFISTVVSLFNSDISLDNSLDVYPLKSVILLVILLVVSFDKSTIVDEISAFKAFKLASMDASIFMD